MAREIIMPKAGMDMKEGKIIKWLVEVGDIVSEGDGLMEIETDKVTMEVEAESDGIVLKRFFDDGATVPVVTVVGYLGEKGEKVPDKPSVIGEESPVIGTFQTAAPEKNIETQRIQKENKNFDYDIAVIGGGPAGYVAAIKAAQLGGKVIIFEKDDTFGGTCLNRGCIPTKTYLKTAEMIHTIKESKNRGINIDRSTLSVDMEKIYAYKEKVVRRLTTGVAGLLDSNAVEKIKGQATLEGLNTVSCNGKQYKIGSILLCGGSEARSLPIPGIDNPGVVTSDGILELKSVPNRLVVIGGGIIGCEMATAFAAFGSKVTIVEMLPGLVGAMDQEISETITKTIKKSGIKVILEKSVDKIEKTEDGLNVSIQGQNILADVVLISVGRTANLSGLGSCADKITTESNKIIVDDKCRTNVSNIYACGDITNRSTLAHAAFKMGEVAAVNAMGRDVKLNLNNVPSCLYTVPEAASVGMTEAEAMQKGNIVIGKFPISANGRALVCGEREGFVKVIADKTYGEILGVHMVGGVATEMIQEAKVLMDMEITIHEVAEIIHAHPTFSEALMEACADALNCCIHLPKKSNN